MLRAQSRVFTSATMNAITTNAFEKSESFEYMMANRGALNIRSSLHTEMQS